MSKVYQIITDRIIEMLESGVIPWEKPWKGAANGDGPANLMSKKPYRGVNYFMLACQPYESQYWLTYNQAKKKGGNVRKGEKGTMVVFWKPMEIEENKNGKTVKSTVPFLRYYTVFNIDQIDGIDGPAPPEPVNPDFQPIERAEEIVANMPNPPAIQHGENRAYYRPSSDAVNMPKREMFEQSEHYYNVLFHELGHSTGHESRLNRPELGKGMFGSEVYSKEELVAEMTAAFLSGAAGIESKTIENSAAYIQSWIKVLKNDPKMVVHAGGAAQKAADWVLGQYQGHQG